MIAPSELIINPDGSCFHLHLKPEQLADKIIMVGDPDRVNTVASYFDTKECEVSSREFHTITGTYKGKRITTLSHGIGTDNIDILLKCRHVPLSVAEIKRPAARHDRNGQSQSLIFEPFCPAFRLLSSHRHFFPRGL